MELKTELQIFLTEKEHRLADLFDDEEWLLKVSYLNNIFTAVIELNLSMQGRDHNIITLGEKLTAFKSKLALWKTKLARGKTASFPSLNELLMNKGELDAEVKAVLLSHLDQLCKEFNKYMPSSQLVSKQWVCSPFDANVEDLSDEVSGLQEEFLELKSEELLREQFKKLRLTCFWTQVKKEKPVLGSEAMEVLLPFSTTYLCEHGFSALTNIKNKVRNRLDPTNDLRLALSRIEPRINDLVDAKARLHKSH